jgi:hypothetical protein
MLSIWKSVGRRGANEANDVMHVQLLLNNYYKFLAYFRAVSKVEPGISSLFKHWQALTWAPGIWLVPDGKKGKNTEKAIEEFQRHVLGRVHPDGKVSPGGETFENLAAAATFMAPPNLTAQFEDVRLKGALNQAMVGRITVNARTYFFNSGGSSRGNLPPGRYLSRMEDYRKKRTERGFNFAHVGYTFGLNLHTNKTRDKRLEKDFGDFEERFDLLIHPDGGEPGTQGCIGLLGGPRTLEAFRHDMLAELDRHDGQVTLHVLQLN